MRIMANVMYYVLCSTFLPPPFFCYSLNRMKRKLWQIVVSNDNSHFLFGCKDDSKYPEKKEHGHVRPESKMRQSLYRNIRKM